MAYRPSSGGADVLQQFGAAGTGQTVPASSVSLARPTTVVTSAEAAMPAVAAMALTDDVAPPEVFAATTEHKRRHLPL